MTTLVCSKFIQNKTELKRRWSSLHAWNSHIVRLLHYPSKSRRLRATQKIFTLTSVVFVAWPEGEGFNHISRNKNLQSSRYSISHVNHCWEMKITSNVIRYCLISSGAASNCSYFLPTILKEFSLSIGKVLFILWAVESTS